MKSRLAAVLSFTLVTCISLIPVIFFPLVGQAQTTPALSATALPDVNTLVKIDEQELSEEDGVYFQRYGTPDAVVAVAEYLPWDRKTVILWSWRIRADGDWRYFIAFSADKIAEIIIPILNWPTYEKNDKEGTLTITLKDAFGKMVDSKTFRKP